MIFYNLHVKFVHYLGISKGKVKMLSQFRFARARKKKKKKERNIYGGGKQTTDGSVLFAFK